MKIATQDIPAIMAQFIDSQVAPQASGLQKFGSYAMLFVVQNKMPEIITRYTPIMQMTGIMSEDGMIDLEYLHNMASEAMNHAGKVNLLGYLMDASDVESLYAIAQRLGR